MGGKRIMLVGALGALGALVVGLGAGSAFGSGPAERVIVPVVGDQFVCEDATYTITSGSIQIVAHEGESASGNENFTFTITPRNVVAEDGDGNVVSIRRNVGRRELQRPAGNGGVHPHGQVPARPAGLRDG